MSDEEKITADQIREMVEWFPYDPEKPTLSIEAIHEGIILIGQVLCEIRDELKKQSGDS